MACGRASSATVVSTKKEKNARSNTPELQNAAKLAREWALIFARNLVDAGGNCPEGFDDDPITYESIGWSGGPVPSYLEAELSKHLACVFREDAQQSACNRQQDERRQREKRSQDVVDSWERKKTVESKMRENEKRIANKQQQEEAQQREKRNQEAVDMWMQRKDEEARTRQKLSKNQQDLAARRKPSPKQCEMHYESWCRTYDVALRRSRSRSA